MRSTFLGAIYILNHQLKYEGHDCDLLCLWAIVCSFVLMEMDDNWQMTTAIAIEDVRREVKILRVLTGHRNLVQFFEAYEDDENVYIVME